MSQTAQWLLFSRGQQNFALSAEALVCQLSAFAWAVLPDTSSGVVGLFNFAGEALPLLDMAAVGGELAEAASNCLVIDIDEQHQLGLLSDEVAELTDIVPEHEQIMIGGRDYQLLMVHTLKQYLLEEGH
ncbi:MAG: chemotaxis protein CheW [Methylophaga sp.]|nr:chemotaxis protein CheW [Methylophaga sp.]